MKESKLLILLAALSLTAWSNQVHAQSTRLLKPASDLARNSKTLTALGAAVSDQARKLTPRIIALFGGAGAVALIEANLREGEAAYCLEIDLNNDASSVYWADYFSKPDIFPLLQIEGIGSILVPEIAHNYAGGKFIWTFKIREIQPWRKVNILILDDDSSSNKAWNGILASRFHVDIGSSMLLAGMSVRVGAGAEIEILDQNVMIDTPDPIASYTITTPRFYVGGDWDTSGSLLDGDKKNVGTISFSMIRNK